MAFNWIVSQIGARQHYGVPRGFVYKGDLRLLYTEAWCRWGSSLLARGNKPMRALAGRYHPDIPNRSVIAFNSRTFREHFSASGVRELFKNSTLNICVSVNGSLPAWPKIFPVEN